MKKFVLITAIIAANLSFAENIKDPRPKLVDLYNTGKKPTLNDLMSIRVGRCYNNDEKIERLAPQPGLFIGEAPENKNGPLFEESDQVQFWAFSEDTNNVNYYDNFPAKDYRNGQATDFSVDLTHRVQMPASSQNTRWVQAKKDEGYDNNEDGSSDPSLPGFNNYRDNYRRKFSKRILAVRKNGNFLITAYGREYSAYKMKCKNHLFAGQECEWETAPYKTGFDINEICYFFKKLD